MDTDKHPHDRYRGDIKREQHEAERKARESEQSVAGSPDYPAQGAGQVTGSKAVERGPDPSPPANESQAADNDPTPGGRAPEGNPGHRSDEPPNLAPRNTIPPNPGSDRGGGVSA